MSCDLIAYEDCKWQPIITVVNPDGSREERELSFSPKEGAKIYIDHAVYGMDENKVSETVNGVLYDHISKERLQALWEEGESQ